MAARRTVVVAAFPPELAPFAPDDAGLARFGETEVRCAPVGIGLVAAALGTARAVADGAARVVFCGTCGAYRGSGLAVPDVVVASRVLWVDPLVEESRARRPPGMGEPLVAERLLTEPGRFEAVARVDVATTASITLDAALGARVLASTGCRVEHLEAYAVAAACASAGVPCTIVLGVANAVGPDAHAEWRANAARASDAVASVVRAALARESATSPA